MKTTTPTINEELNTIVELSIARYNELLNNITTVQEGLDLLHDAEHELSNIEEHKMITQSLVNDRDIYAKLVVVAIKRVIASNVKELPLTVLINTLAEHLLGRKSSNRLRIAATLVKLLQASKLFTVYYKLNKEGYRERVVNCTFGLSEATRAELLAKTRNLPLDMPIESSSKVAGHRKKLAGDNEHMLHLTDKLNAVGYKLDERVWSKFKYELASYRFADMVTQAVMVSEGDKLLGKTFYFNHRFGPDNGRIYCDGDLFTLQGGALNYAYKFADKRMLSARGLEVLRTKVKELHSEDKLSFKETVEMYSLTLDLIDAEQGRPVGTILHIDAKLSGLQHQSIAIRDKASAVYCGLLSHVEDGYGHIRSMLSNKDNLTRDMVKKAYNPYQYGAGALATVTPVREAGGDLDFKEWEAAYKGAFPRAYELRTFLLVIAGQYASDIHRFVSPSGFNCIVTGLGTEADNINTCYGKIKYERKEVNKRHMGVKLVAAFSHMLDASAEHYIIDKSNFDLHVVHDSFGSHPNDTDTVHTLYIQANQNHLCTPVLKNFVASIVGAELAEVNVSRLMSNTLHPADIVGGLY